VASFRKLNAPLAFLRLNSAVYSATIDVMSVDPRHQLRIEVVQSLFAFSFYRPEDVAAFDGEKWTLIADIVPELPEIDAEIQQFAPERPLSDINKVDLAVLRVIVFESRHKKTPKKVLVDEAVELAKELGSDNSAKFVNGVLGQMLLPTTTQVEQAA
jgi:transcription antitermination factor NusB